MKTKKIIGFLLIMCIFTSTGCEKYDKGGSVWRSEYKIRETWKLQKYLINGVDKTSQLYIKNYEETYTTSLEDSTSLYTLTYIDKNNKTVTENGDWKFDKEDKKLFISGVNSIEITDTTLAYPGGFKNILKLDRNELWYSYKDGANTHELHLVEK